MRSPFCFTGVLRCCWNICSTSSSICTRCQTLYHASSAPVYVYTPQVADWRPESMGDHIHTTGGIQSHARVAHHVLLKSMILVRDIITYLKSGRSTHPGGQIRQNISRHRFGFLVDRKKNTTDDDPKNKGARPPQRNIKGMGYLLICGMNNVHTY